MRSITLLVTCLVLFAAAVQAWAHDTWVQTNTNIVRVGDAIHVDLLLGNHGNNHRDFKIAGKASTKNCTLDILAPGGKRYDLIDQLSDIGYAPNEGFWTTRFVASKPGLYVISHTLDQVMPYGPVRAIKSAKSCFVTSESLDRVPREQPGFDHAFGHPLELVPTSNPVVPMGPDRPMSVQLLFNGKPVAGETVSFIPRGETLSPSFDERFERTTDNQGRASFTPKGGNYYLVAAHRDDPSAKGEGYEKTKYSATLTVFVPESCSCCVE